MESRAFLGFWMLGVALVGPAFAQSSPVITMEKVMTGEQLRRTGVEGLTPAQRSVLDQWLSEYTLQVMQFAQGSPRPATPAPPVTQEAPVVTG